MLDSQTLQKDNGIIGGDFQSYERAVEVRERAARFMIVSFPPIR